MSHPLHNMETNLTPIKESIDLFLYENQGVIITNPEQYTNAGDVLKAVKNKIKSLEEQRKSYTAPLDEAKKKLMADFKEVITPLEELENKIKSTMISWASAEQKRLDAEQARIDAEALAKAKAEKISEVVVPLVNTQVKTQRGTFSTTTLVKRWTWKLVDLEKVPRQYLTLDSPSITYAVREGKRQIEGIEIYQEEGLTSR